MGELGDGSGTSFPSTLDSNTKIEYDVESAEKTLVRAAIPNDIAAALVAVETELGTDVAGSATDLKTRLAVTMANDGYVGEIRYTNQFDTIQAAITDLPT